MNSNDFRKFSSQTSGELLFCLILTGNSLKKNSTSTENDWTIYDDNHILPYYIVKFDSVQQVNYQQQKLLDDEWKDMEGDAKVDKLMDDAQQYYHDALKKKKKEREMGEIDSNWFDDYYAQNNKSNEKPIDLDDLDTPIEDDIDYEITPSTAKTDVDYDFDDSPEIIVIDE